MSSALTLASQATPNAPSSGRISIYMDATTGYPYWEDSSGNTHPFVSGTAPAISGANITASSIPDSALAIAYVESIAAAGALTLAGSGRNPTVTLAGNAVSNNYLAQVPANTLKGNATGSTANVTDLTGTQVTAMLALASLSAQGLMSAKQYQKLSDIWYDACADFGLVNDPGATSVAANTTAMNNAIAALNATPYGGIIFIPDGYYTFNGPMTTITQTGVRIIGQSRTNTILINASATGDFFPVTGWYCQFEELQLQAQYTTIAAGSSGATASTVTTLNVASTASFPSSGTIYVQTSSTSQTWAQYTYTGTNGTQFTGCTLVAASVGTATTLATTGGYVLEHSSGYAINHSSGNYLIVRHCEFDLNYNIINLTGQNDHVDDINSRNFAGGIIAINGTNQNLYFNHIFAENPCQGTYGISCPVNLGSLLIDNCGFSQCGTTLSLAATAGVTIPTIYASNTFFDTGLYGMRVNGTSTSYFYRSLFSNCWFSSHVFHGVSFEQLNIDGIDFEQCHFFGNGGWGIYAPSGGIRWNVNPGCKFAGNTSGGISISPNTNGNSQVKVFGSTIGPCAAFGANAVGIVINAGTYTSIDIKNNDISGNTGSGITDNSTTVGTKIIRDNIGAIVVGGLASFTATSLAATTTEAQVIAATIPAYAAQIGTTYRITAFGQATVTTANGTTTWVVRIGPTSLSGAIVFSLADATSAVGTAIAFSFTILVTIKTIGATGTAIAFAVQTNNGTTGIATTNGGTAPSGAAPTAATVNTTVANIIEFTMKTSATTTLPTIYLATIECVK